MLSKRNRRHRTALVASLVVVCMAWTADAPAQSSSVGYTQEQSTVNGGGGPIASVGYSLNGSAGQEAAIGASSSPNWVVQSGFWSFVGSTLVPVVLFADKNSGDPEDVDLSWSGNNSPYQLYASDDCTNIHAYWLTTEASNSFTDSPPPDALTCYSVLATAPGPLRQPEAVRESGAERQNPRIEDARRPVR